MRNTDPACPLDAGEFERRMTPFDVPPGAHVAVAVSGGADSLALALVLGEWAAARGVRVTALTVDHQLRLEARDEARRVRDWLAAWGVAHETLTWEDGAFVDTAVQARARDARYGMMATWCCDRKVAHLFAAHHLDDQAETVLMRLKRATTLHGLAAMRPMRALTGGETDAVTLCRPFLDVPKARLVATLKARRQPWIEDPSNRDPAYERVRVRRLMKHLAEDGVTPARLAGAARAAGALSDVLARAAAAFAAEHGHTTADGGVAWDADAFARLPDVLAQRVVRDAVQNVGARAYPPAPDKVRRMAAAMRRGDFTARTLGGCVVRRTRGRFVLARAPMRRTGRGAVPKAPECRGKGAFLPPKTCPGGAKALHLCEARGAVETAVPNPPRGRA